jgi:tRNA(Ile)-lysidine synthase
MLDAVRAFIRGHALLAEGEAVTVAVSGGVDSMVLLHALRALGHPVSVLHVDHGLRGAESDQDRVFVEQHAVRAGIPCEVVAVDVHKAMGSGDSVQMAARRLRYGVFQDQLQQGGALALGHHRDDAVESLLIEPDARHRPGRAGRHPRQHPDRIRPLREAPAGGGPR